MSKKQDKLQASASRVLISREQFNRLEILYANAETIREAMTSWYFNPTYHYPEGADELEGEVGHDDKYRYVRKKKPEPEPQHAQLITLLKELSNEDWENYSRGKTAIMVLQSYARRIEELFE